MAKVLSFFLIIVLSGACLGQSESATLSGRVTDPSGSAVVGTEVVLTNTDTNVEIRTKTNGAGLYVFTGVHPGKYRVAAGAAGFKVLIKEGLVLHVQDELAENFALTLGTVSETVTVTADATRVNTTDASVSTVVDRNFAENLPMNGRSFQTLIELTPGVVLTQSNQQDNGQFSVNGQRASANYWMVDGVSANIGVSTILPGNGLGGTLGSFSALGGTNSLVSVDALQEFRIQTSTFAPEFGRTPGGQISMVTRSGTNQFHGTAFDYFRNDVLDASDWFNGYTHNPPLLKAKERQNDFGGTLGGPIVKDRTFFFFSYEGLRLRLPQTALTTVPDLSARQDAQPSLRPYLNAFPVQEPNANDDLASGIAEYDATFSNPGTLDAYSLRVDQKLRDKLTLFGRYNYSPSEIDQRGIGGQALTSVTVSKITTQTATVGATWLMSPMIANDFRVNYSRTNASGSNHLDNFGGATPLTSLPFPSPFTSQNGQFQFQIGSLNLGSLLETGPLAHNLQRQVNILDNVSLQTGGHSLRFGFDFRRLSPISTAPSYTQTALFGDVPSAETGNTTFGFIFASTDVRLLFRNLGAFAQDTWRIGPRLTLTYGIRWDVDFAPSSLAGPNIPAVTGYDLTDFSQLAVAAPGSAPFSTTYGNVAPRVGLAYQVTQRQDWQSVLRGGFGVFYDLVSSEAGNLIGNVGTPPFGASSVIPATTFPYSPMPAPPLIPSTGTISSLDVFNPNLKLPYTLQWNISFDQALGREQTATASYIGAAGKRLLQSSVVISPSTNPNVSGLFVDNTGSSDYQALQLKFQRRLSHGLQALVSYTWSHSTDTGSTGSFALPSNAGVPGNQNLNRGPSDFDIRNSFTAGLTFDIPAPSGNAFANAALRGWSTENFILARSAPPVDVTDYFYSLFLQCFLPGGVSFSEIRPNLVGGQPLYLYGSQYPGGKAFNPAGFTDPPADPATGCPASQGNVPRNFLRGFGATQWDFSVHRDFTLHESLKLQFRAEMFNVLNHPNFGQPYPLFGLPGFGKSIQMLGQSLNGSNLGGGAFSPLYQVGGPRSIQFALKFSF